MRVEEVSVPDPSPAEEAAPPECWEGVKVGQHWPRHVAMQSTGASWYITISIGTRHVDLLIDTGAQVSLLSKQEYDEIPGANREKLRPVEGKISAANGGPINIYGKVELTLCLERMLYPCEFLVADIGGLPGLLGMDF